jgi:hypothetical protein
MTYILWEHNRRDGLIEKRSTIGCAGVSLHLEYAEHPWMNSVGDGIRLE